MILNIFAGDIEETSRFTYLYSKVRCNFTGNMLTIWTHVNSNFLIYSQQLRFGGSFIKKTISGRSGETGEVDVVWDVVLYLEIKRRDLY